ncbi:MAG: phytanoyl-CoA dioxygenase family protein [Acidimicrobiales bacterium]
MAGTGVLTPQQVSFYETFGFLRLPGLFSDDIGEIERGFEAVFADEAHPRMEIDVELHNNEPRTMVPQFIDKHPALAGLSRDPRILGVVGPLLGEQFEYAESDGNLYFCDSEWHCDIYGSPMDVRHVKLSFYLDPLRGDSGAPRLIPGTNHWQSGFARRLRANFKDFGQIPSIYGVEGPEVPSVTLDSDPGDLLLWDFRTIHASYFGLPRRRLFTLNFREVASTQAVAV